MGSCLALAQQRSLTVIVPSQQSLQERTLTRMFREETGARTADHLQPLLATGLQGLLAVQSHDVVLVAQRDALPALLPAELRNLWTQAVSSLRPDRHAEGFFVVELTWRTHHITLIAGNDSRGELFGAGWVLRQMRFATGTPSLPGGLRTYQAPDKPVRGHQIGYRFKNNTYDAWNLSQFEQHIRDLAIFGTNTIQVIAPDSDDAAASPLFPAPALATIAGISGLARQYGLDCDLYYPEMKTNYADPATIAAELASFEALIKALPAVDALYVPGGDPGHTPPGLLLPLVEQEAAILHRYHPRAPVWISAQGFDQAWYEQFYALLDRHPAWLTGVFFGPQSRDSFQTQRQRIPRQYAMQFYPDIGHTMHAQFPVPEWDPIWALTEGREPICPRPQAFAAIYDHFRELHAGFITYSEGVNDDVNKMLWSQLGWSLTTPVDTILGEYARWFLHREGEQNSRAVQAIEGLEQDWQGPLTTSASIAKTRARFAELEASSTPAQVEHNGRWESLLYRANYDDYLQHKLRRERTAEGEAMAHLSDASLGDSAAQVAAALAALTATRPDATEQAEHDALFSLAHRLFDDWGLQLSVKLYGASNWERGANLDRVDTPVIERAWLEKTMAEALKQPAESARQLALQAIVHWADPVPGAIYDDLGDPSAEPHLVRGRPWQQDPELFHAAIDGIADRTLALPWRTSWLDYAETLYETPLTLHYSDLNPAVAYRVRITYAGEDYALALRLTANGVEVHPARLRKANPETVEFPLPPAALTGGTLDLQWTGPAGAGGSGRGRQVAEVWLLPAGK